MSLNIKTQSGLVQIAGNTILLNGSSAEIRTGTYSIQCAGNSGSNATVTFNTPMTDTDYIVIFSSDSPAAGEVGFRTKTTTGFNLYVLGGRDNDSTVYTFTGTYYAFRLIELEGYNYIYNKVYNPDSTPTENSTNLVTSGGVYDAIKNASSVFVGTAAEWAAETDKTDFNVALITDAGTVNAVDDTTGDTEVVANKNVVFKGTLTEWEALTTAQKKAYDEALITNDMDTGEVVDAVTDGDMRAVTSNAVYDTLVNTTIIQSNVKRSETRDPTQSTWYSASLQKPTIPASKRLVRWLAFIDASDIAVSVGSRNGDIDNCILVHGNNDLPTTPITYNIWWGAEVADL